MNVVKGLFHGFIHCTEANCEVTRRILTSQVTLFLSDNLLNGLVKHLAKSSKKTKCRDGIKRTRRVSMQNNSRPFLTSTEIMSGIYYFNSTARDLFERFKEKYHPLDPLHKDFIDSIKEKKKETIKAFTDALNEGKFDNVLLDEILTVSEVLADDFEKMIATAEAPATPEGKTVSVEVLSPESRPTVFIKSIPLQTRRADLQRVCVVGYDF